MVACVSSGIGYFGLSFVAEIAVAVQDIHCPCAFLCWWCGRSGRGLREKYGKIVRGLWEECAKIAEDCGRIVEGLLEDCRRIEEDSGRIGEGSGKAGGTIV